MTNLEKVPVDTTFMEEHENLSPQSSDLLTPSDVAKRLGVGEKTAISVMRGLPHVNVSMEIYSKKKRLRITERVFFAYRNGEIQRKPEGSTWNDSDTQ